MILYLAAFTLYIHFAETISENSSVQERNINYKVWEGIQLKQQFLQMEEFSHKTICERF